jgi:AcrR family transcriptional regulator
MTDIGGGGCSLNEEACAKRRPRDRQATEASLVSAASVLFAEKGYENSSTRNIADIAGCSESLIQRYFKGKEGLLLAVLEQRHQHSPDAEFFDGPLCSSLAEEARLTFKSGILTVRQRSDTLHIVLSRVLIDHTFKEHFNRVSLRSWTKAKIKARLERYAAAGMIAPGLDIEITSELMMSLRFQLGFVYPQLLQCDVDELQRMVDAFAEMFSRAVSAQTDSR